MANLFAIALAENKQVYQPGETISGVLLLNTDKDLTLRGIRVELHGLGHVRIRSGKVTYERKETYLGLQAILLGRGKDFFETFAAFYSAFVEIKRSDCRIPGPFRRAQISCSFSPAVDQ